MPVGGLAKRGKYGGDRRHATASSPRPTTAAGTARAGPARVTDPPGSPAAQRATAIRATRNGSARRQARSATQGATGAVAAATTPRSIGPPASGRPSRLAGSPASETEPKTRASTGMAATWAPRVMPTPFLTR
ncbi:MAG: hypothetical protein K0S88_6849, partial [Actinomycetia bacterium]|nr:hypothetical protein [Actinomycetes bacterium]